MTKEFLVTLAGRSLSSDVIPFRTGSAVGSAVASMQPHVTAPFMLAGRIRNRDQLLNIEEPMQLRAPSFERDGGDNE